MNNLVIEVTRRCNMVCDHCLRGPAENKDIDLRYIDQLFQTIKGHYVSSLTITGGEPSLNVEAIEYIIESARVNSVDVGNFYIATNGKEVSDKFFLVISKLHVYCSENDISSIYISNDQYHWDIDNENIEKLEVYSFTDNTRIERYFPINEGYATINGLGNRFADRNDTLEELLYLNVEGYILSCCDLSYESQREESICHISDTPVLEMKLSEAFEDAINA